MLDDSDDESLGPRDKCSEHVMPPRVKCLYSGSFVYWHSFALLYSCVFNQQIFMGRLLCRQLWELV